MTPSSEATADALLELPGLETHGDDVFAVFAPNNQAFDDLDMPHGTDQDAENVIELKDGASVAALSGAGAFLTIAQMERKVNNAMVSFALLTLC